ncbi:MAG: 5-formyltetrahydrofolate cyclo-ligase [Candidatus Peregrinibacteria bacterium]
MKTKNEIRQKALKTRNGLPPDLRREKSGKIAQALESLEEFKRAHDVLFYYAVGSEVETKPLIEKYLKEKRLYLPAIQNENEFHAVSTGTALHLTKGQKGIPEPQGGGEAKTLDLILVPGVAFDQKGGRLGTGKGYYDRFLKRYPHALKIGLAYREQMVENVPQDPYDVPVDRIITDQKQFIP